MRFWFSFFAFVLLFFSVSSEPPQAYIAVDTRNGKVLYAKNADCQTQPASLTKIMLLYIAFRELNRGRLRLNTMMTVSRHAASQKPSSLNLRVGERISCRNAILAIMTKSANDAAVVLAEHIAGSEPGFVTLMNREARILRMHSTVFCNASGWKNRRQLTTARDMAKLSRAIMAKYPNFFRLFSTKTFKYKNRIYANHNKLLGEHRGIRIDGIKTGYVCASGFNISTSAVKGRDRIIVIFLGGRTAIARDSATKWLIQCAFNKMDSIRVFAGKIPERRSSVARQSRKIFTKKRRKPLRLKVSKLTA